MCPYGMAACFEGCQKRCTAEGWDAFMFDVRLSEKQKRGRLRSRNVGKYQSVYNTKWDGKTRHVSL